MQKMALIIPTKKVYMRKKRVIGSGAKTRRWVLSAARRYQGDCRGLYGLYYTVQQRGI